MSPSEPILPHRVWSGRAGGPVLVLSHSLGNDLSQWEPQLESLGSRFRLLLHDHRGHGRSGLPAGPWQIADFGRDLLALLDREGIARAHFCGVSLGGIAGLWLGQNAPDRVDRLVLANCSAAIEEPALLRRRGDLVATGGMEAIAEGVVERWLTPAFRAAFPQIAAQLLRTVLTTPPEGYRLTCEALCSFDLRPKLKSVTSPALVVLGRHDAATPPDWTRRMAADLPRHQLLELESAHLSNIEAADAFNAAVLDFLS